MSVTTPVSNMSDRDQEVLEELVAGACAAVAEMCSATAAAAGRAVQRERALNAAEHQARLRADLGAALSAVRALRRLEGGRRSGTAATRGLRASGKGHRLTGGLHRVRRAGLRPLAIESKRAQADAAPAAAPTPLRTIDLVWTDLESAAAAFADSGCRIRTGASTIEVFQDTDPILRARRVSTSRFSVDVLNVAGAVALESANRTYIQRTLARHAEQSGATVENRPDGTAVVRPPQSPRSRAVTLPQPAAGTVEVDFAGYRGAACRRALANLERSTGLRATRPPRGKGTEQLARAGTGAATSKKR